MPVKMSARTPGEKLLTLYTYFMLKGRRHTSLTELADTLACSKQTVLRLLAQLEASGYGKLEPPARQGRELLYRMAPAPAPDLDLGVMELAQLALCRNMLVSTLPNAVGKLLNEKTSDKGGFGAVYTKGRIDYEPFQSQYAAMTRALRQKRLCHISYRKNPYAPPRDFLFAPMRLVAYHETISFVGWEVENEAKVCPRFPEPLTLHLQRCLEVAPTQTSSEPLPDLAAGDDTGGAFGFMRGEPFSASILFEPEAAAYVHDRQWSENQTMRLREDGKLELTITARSKPEIISWILSFGSRARAIAPDWLKAEIREQVAKLSEIYADGKKY